jgi:hypothetical protein
MPVNPADPRCNGASHVFIWGNKPDGPSTPGEAVPQPKEPPGDTRCVCGGTTYEKSKQH